MPANPIPPTPQEPDGPFATLDTAKLQDMLGHCSAKLPAWNRLAALLIYWIEAEVRAELVRRGESP